jgi:two-component sensor histidine kinase
MPKIVFLLLLSLGYLCAQVVNVENITQKMSGFTLEYHVDTTGLLDFEAIKKVAFTQKTPNPFSLGFLYRPVWFKFTLENDANVKKDMILSLEEVFYDSVNLYYDTPNNTKAVQKNGIGVDVYDRAIKHPDARFKISLLAHEKRTLYIKTTTVFGVFGEILLYDAAYYYERFDTKTFTYTFYLGAVFVIAFYNLFLFLYLRKKVYLYYFGYSLSFGLWVGGFFGGIAFYFIPIEYDYPLHVVTPLAIIFLSLFSNEVLRVKQKYPVLHKFFTVNIVLLVFAAAFILLSNDITIGFQFTNFVATYIFYFYIYIAIKEIAAKNKLALLYLVAIGVFLVTISMLSMMAMGWLPNTFYTRYAFIVGSFIEIVLLSLLLAYRIDILQKSYQSTLQIEIQRQTQNLNDKNKQLTTLIAEKEELLREMFHRVKNNFQVLIALLTTQIEDEQNKSVKDKLESIIKRLQSLAIIHDLLYGKSTKSHTDMKRYLQMLTTHLSVPQIKLNVDLQPFSIDAFSAKAVGLIVNELFTNSLKHGGIGAGKNVFIACKKDRGRVELRYVDEGKGFDVPTQKKGYGTVFIDEFAARLNNCTIDCDTQNGVRYTITFTSD